MKTKNKIEGYICCCFHCCLVSKLCLTLCPVDHSQLASSVLGDFRARILEWVAISFSRIYSPPRDWTCVSCFGKLASGFFTTEPPGKPRAFSNPSPKKGKAMKVTILSSNIQLIYSIPYTKFFTSMSALIKYYIFIYLFNSSVHLLPLYLYNVSHRGWGWCGETSVDLVANTVLKMIF